MADDKGEQTEAADFFSSDIFRAFATYVALLVLKMLVLTYFTISERVLKGVYSNREDYEAFGDPNMTRDEMYKKADERDLYIERIRRCHRNDLENIPAFILVALVYILTTDPTPAAALLHFRIFAASRIFHSVAYLLPLPQPCRLFGLLVGTFVIISMSVRVLYLGMF